MTTPPNVLFSASPAAWEAYQSPLTRALDKAGIKANLATDHAPENTDYIVYAPQNGPAQGLSDFTPYRRCKAVLSLWAGVDTIAANQSLTQPLARMVDPGLTQGMVEYVTGHVLRHHLGMDHFIHGTGGTWDQRVPPLASDRPVTILGLGALGLACAKALQALGFPVTGWSRSEKSVPGITTLSGSGNLPKALKGAEITVLLLPATGQTTHILNAQTLALLPKGAILINPGRGSLIDDTALLHALDKGQIGHATLDTFQTEPLPPSHPYWHHDNVTITPHIASETRPETAALAIAENIRRSETGAPLLHLVDRQSGY